MHRRASRFDVYVLILALAISLFYLFSQAFSVSASVPMLYLGNDSYSIGQKVEISLSGYMDEDTYSLDIITPSKTYSYLFPGSKILFIPKEEGYHEAVLKKGQDIHDLASFYVFEEIKTDSLVDEGLSSDKETYSTEDQVIIDVKIPGQYVKEDYDLEVLAQDKKYVFFDIVSGPVRFFPKDEGQYFVKLLRKGEQISQIFFNVGKDAAGLDASVEYDETEKGQVNDMPFRIEGKGKKQISYEAHETEVSDKGISISSSFSQDEYVEVSIDNHPIKKMKIRNPRADPMKQGIIRIDDIEKDIEVGALKALKAYAIDPTGASFDDAEVTSVAEGEVLWKCAEWDFEDQLCLGSWVRLKEITPGKNYSFSIGPDDPGFAETGVATINSDKPIYHPGEAASLTVAILDRYGYLSDDAAIEIEIASPSGEQDFFSSQEDELLRVEKGIYLLTYNNTFEQGDYSIEVSAAGPNVNRSMISLFKVMDFYDFDILRDIPYSMDPWAGPLDSRIYISSYSYTGTFDVVETVPSSFDIIDPMGGSVEEGEYYDRITWQDVKNSSYVSYLALVPLSTPEMYSLGQAEVHYNSSIFYEVRPWYLAVDPVPATAYFDPTTTIASGWADGSGTTYAEVDDGTRWPSTPITNDYVASTANDNVISEFGFPSITQGNIGNITLWVYTSTGSNARYTFYLQQSGTTRCSNSVPVSTSSSWRSCTWTNPTGDLSAITVELGGVTKSGGGAPQNANVFAAYLEVNYTDNEPSIVSLNNPENSSVLTESIIDFNFTASDDYGILNCTLYTNRTGWSAEKTSTSVVSSVNTNITVSMPDGRYSWNIICFDNSVARQYAWYSSNYSFVSDTSSPSLSGVSANPSPGTIAAPVNISSYITDLIGVDTASVEMTFPNLSKKNISLINSGNAYSLLFNETYQIGRYDFRFIANDTLGHMNDTVSGFFNITLETLSLTTSKTTYVLGETADFFGKGFNAFEDVTLYLYDATGDPVQGYPINVTSNITGGINYSWNIPLSSVLGTYRLNATEVSDRTRSINTSFFVVSAIVQAGYTDYEQGMTINITGYNWDPSYDVTINITSPSGILVYGPINITANSTGNINFTWQIPYDSEIGKYVISAYEPENIVKQDSFEFMVTARPVSLSIQYLWYREGDVLNLTGSGFSPNSEITIYLVNSSDDPVFGYPLNVSSNSTGNINHSLAILGLDIGTYTFYANDSSYTNLGASDSFSAVIPIVVPDDIQYNEGDAVVIEGYYWNRGDDVTLDVINISSLSESGYPKAVSVDQDGYFSDTLTARAIGFAPVLFNVSAVQASWTARNNFTVAREAVLYTDKSYYVQKEIVNITGDHYTPGENVTLWIKSLETGGNALGYPKSISADPDGVFSELFNITDYCDSSYMAIGTDETNPLLLNATALFNVRTWWDSAWRNRMPVYVSDFAGGRTNTPILLNVTGLGGAISDCGELRVISTETGNPVPYNLFAGDDSTWCEIEFLGSVSDGAAAESNYYVYYNNSAASFPGYGSISETTNLIYDAFDDAGLDNWTQDAQNDWDRDIERSYNLNGGSAHVDGAATNAWLSLLSSINMSPDRYREANVSFAWFIEAAWDGGESIVFQMYDGTVWNQIESITGTGGGPPGAEEDVWITHTVSLTQAYFVEDFNIRFSSTVSGADEDGFVDVVSVDAVYKGTPGISASVGGSQEYFTCRVIDGSSPYVEITNLGEQHNTIDDTPQVNFTATDDLDALLDYEVYVGDAPNGQVGTISNNTELSLDISALSQGYHNVSIYVQDDFFNRGYDSVYFLIDYEGPVTDILAPENFTEMSENSYIVSASSSDNYIGTDTVYFSFRQDGLSLWSDVCSDSRQPFQCTWDISSLAEGDSYEVRAYSVDKLGNIGENDTSYNITIDRSGPLTSLINPANFTNISEDSYIVSASSSDLWSNVDIVDFFYREDDLDTWHEICSDGRSPYQCTWDTSMLDDGNNYQVGAYANDSLGNIGEMHVSYNITLDRQPPEINNVSILPLSQKIGNAVDIAANITDLSPLSEVWINITLPGQAGIYDEMDLFLGLYNYTFYDTNVTGIYVIEIYANDSLGNFRREEYNFSVNYSELYLDIEKTEYVANEVVYFSAYGFNMYSNVTIDIYNSTGEAVSGYPYEALTNLTGGIFDSWTLDPDQDLGTYYINITDTLDVSRSILGYISVVSALIRTEFESYEQAETVLIKGSYWDAFEDVTVNITSPSGYLAYGPLNITANSTGHINSTWQIPYDAELGDYIISAYEPSNMNKMNSYVFSIVQRPVSLYTDEAWYRPGGQAYALGSGFSPGAEVTLYLTDSIGSVQAGYPLNDTSDASGDINHSFNVPVTSGTYFINATDQAYPNLWNFTDFIVAEEMVISDKESYVNGQIITISGQYWTRLTNITLDILNSSGLSISGYPVNVSTDSDGSFTSTLIAEATGLGISQYQIYAYNPSLLSENSSYNYTVQRVAILDIGDEITDQFQELNISGSYFSQGSEIVLTILYENRTGYDYYYPKDLFSDGTGDVSFLYDTEDICEGTYLIEMQDSSFSSLYANKTFEVMFLEDNSSLRKTNASSPSGTYNLYSPDNSKTKLSDNSWQYIGGADYGSNFNAYINYTFDLFGLDYDSHDIQNMSFTIEYCHSGVQLNPTCNQGIGAHEGITNGIQKIQAYNHSSGAWADVSELPVDDSTDDEQTIYFTLEEGVSDYVSDDKIFLRIELDFNQTDFDDDLLLIDYISLDFAYLSDVDRQCTAFTDRYVHVLNLNSSSRILEETSVSIRNSTDMIDKDEGEFFRYLPFDELEIRVDANMTFGNASYVLYGLQHDSPNTLMSQIIEEYSHPLPEEIKNITPLVAVNDTDLNFFKAQIRVPKNGLDINTIVHCKNYSYSQARCFEFELNDTDDYEFYEDEEDIIFNVTSFDAFGGGAGNTLPNISAINIYNVTGLADTHSGGELIGSGLSETFNLSGMNQYRVEILVTNEGRSWTIDSSDVAYHFGLNTTWVVQSQDIWYRDGGNLTNYTGGSFSSGTVAWDLSLGGRIRTSEIGTFNYVVNITSNRSKQYPVYFLVNDTSTSSGSYDNSVFNVYYMLSPEVYLEYPLDEGNFTKGDINFSWIAVDGISEEINCSLYIDGQANQTGIISGNGELSSAVAALMQPGRHDWSVECIAENGQIGYSQTRNLTVIGWVEGLDINITEDNSSIELNWTPVLYADHYDVYMALNYSAGFSETPIAAGITDTNWTDIGALSDAMRYYKIEAVKGDASYTDNLTAGFQTTEMETGWNLISIPFDIRDWMLYDGSSGKKVFTDTDCIVSLWRFNSSIQAYDRTDLVSDIWVPAIGSESFLYLDPHLGYWAETSSGCNLTMYGRVPRENITVGLEELWNVNGRHSARPLELGDESQMKTLILDPEGSVQAISRYDAGSDSFEVIAYFPGFGWWPSFNNPDFWYIEPMKGYYLDSNQSATWTIDPERGS